MEMNVSPHGIENPAARLEALSDFAGHQQLEELQVYCDALAVATAVLVAQGGVVTLPDLPTIILPDLHARRELFIDVLSARLPEGPLAGEQVFELLRAGRINLLCVGDLVHSEQRDHWVINRDGEWTQDLLDKEMVRSLGAGMMAMYLKIEYPEHFYCLRGNHDDIAGELAADFRKFVGLKYNEQDELVYVDGQPYKTGDKGESQLVREWVLNREGWGQSFLEAWARFERGLPLLALGPYYVVTHTLPRSAVSAADLHNPTRPREASLELTSRRGIHREAIAGTLDDLGIGERVQHWFYGHSMVSKETNGGRYEEGLDGLLVRLNSPKRHVFAYVPASTGERRFEPERDVFIKDPGEGDFTCLAQSTPS